MSRLSVKITRTSTSTRSAVIIVVGASGKWQGETVNQNGVKENQSCLLFFSLEISRLPGIPQE